MQAGEELDGLSTLERLLRCEVPVAHDAISDILWEAASDSEAAQQLLVLAEQDLAAWEEEGQGMGAVNHRDEADERAEG